MKKHYNYLHYLALIIISFYKFGKNIIFTKIFFFFNDFVVLMNNDTYFELALKSDLNI